MTIKTNVDQVEQIIYPRLSALGYHLRQAMDREAWYITNRETGTLYVLLNNGLEWHVNEMSGSGSEREMLEKEIRASAPLRERDAIFLNEAAHEEASDEQQ
ncbi:hypothetical protein HJG54_15440 [Leptolyngbya sp. NK1-12]|uniref:Uncharacterized protein n=1 Tax=Leptolyngbya sp. NK1-12 TaxID=2547451 RepID=A0AA96WF98_9CYAN|nr:hypothetical protein [Leptolyngbya sp. NK1-12]WNZ24118.1 hypothetical protein HJG54_15440 [Leptolyngbya sp. NK1-12]